MTSPHDMTVQGSPTPTASTSCRPSSAVTGRSDEATLPATGRRRRRRRVSWPGRNEVERPRPLAAILDFSWSKCGSQAIFIRVWVLSLSSARYYFKSVGSDVLDAWRKAHLYVAQERVAGARELHALCT
jgi:hypothetical protein